MKRWSWNCYLCTVRGACNTRLAAFVAWLLHDAETHRG